MTENLFHGYWIGTEALIANRRFDALATCVSCPFAEYCRLSIPIGRAAMHPDNATREPLQSVDFRSQDEIALGEPVDLMRPDRYLCFAPAKANIGMMTLIFRQFANLIDELEAFAKVLEPICFYQMMFVDDL